MHTNELKQEALRLRCEERLGLKPIASILGISQSTASIWLRDHPLSSQEIKQKEVDGRLRGLANRHYPSHLELVETKGFDNVSQKLKKTWIIHEQEERCNRCGLDQWLGEPIPLELEHKDGNPSNDSRENLECLCPNCHAQTPYYRAKNVRAFKKLVSDDELIQALKEKPNIRQALIHVGLPPKGKSYERARRLLQAPLV